MSTHPDGENSHRQLLAAERGNGPRGLGWNRLAQEIQLPRSGRLRSPAAENEIEVQGRLDQFLDNESERVLDHPGFENLHLRLRIRLLHYLSQPLDDFERIGVNLVWKIHRPGCQRRHIRSDTPNRLGTRFGVRSRASSS